MKDDLQNFNLLSKSTAIPKFSLFIFSFAVSGLFGFFRKKRLLLSTIFSDNLSMDIEKKIAKNSPDFYKTMIVERFHK